MICPNCKTENSPASLLCVNCGASLTEAASQSANAQSANPQPVSLGKNPVDASGGIPIVEAASGTAAPLANGEGAAYQASGKFESSGVPLLLVTGVVSALLVGLLYFFVSQFINLILIFPLIAGALVGFGITFAVRAGKIRNPKLVGFVAVLAGLLMMGTMHMARAWQARPDLIDGFTQYEVEDATAAAKASGTALTPTQLASLKKNTRAEISGILTPFRTLTIYEQLAAENGTSIGRAGSGSSGSGLPIKGNIYWLLRLGELLAVIVASAAVASSAASEPFCEGCNKWQEDEEVLKVHPGQNDEVWQKIGARDWDGLMAMQPGEALDEKNVTTLKITHCPDCGSGTIGATSAGGQVPPEFSKRIIAPESTRALLQKSGDAKRPATG